MNWSYRYPALTHWGDESTTHVTLHLCGFLLVCDQCVCFLRLYKFVDKGQYFCLYSLHCCTLQMAPWIFLTCYTCFGLCLHFPFDVFFFLFERLPAVGFNKFVYLTVDNCEKKTKKPNQWLNSGGKIYPPGGSSNVILDSSSHALENPDGTESSDFKHGWWLPTHELNGLWGRNTCRQKAKESSEGHHLNSLTIATDVDSHEEQKVNLSTVLMDGSYIRLAVIKAKETSWNYQVPLLCDLWQVSEILSFLILICKLKRLLFPSEC